MKETPFILDQKDFDSYNTLADADTEILFKTPGLQVYIISEDKFYYWNNMWVLESTGGSGPGTDIKVKISLNDTVPDFLENKLKNGRNTTVVKNNPGGNENLQINVDNTSSIWVPAPHIHPATDITYNNVVSGLVSNTAQDAIDETVVRIKQLEEDVVALVVAFHAF